MRAIHLLSRIVVAVREAAVAAAEEGAVEAAEES
jgi:uncharacterized membrane protein